jgi:hypothetical protein
MDALLSFFDFKSVTSAAGVSVGDRAGFLEPPVPRFKRTRPPPLAISPSSSSLADPGAHAVGEKRMREAMLVLPGAVPPTTPGSGTRKAARAAVCKVRAGGECTMVAAEARLYGVPGLGFFITPLRHDQHTLRMVAGPMTGMEGVCYGTVEARGYCYVVHWNREDGHPMVPSPHDQVSAVTDVVRAVTHELLYRLRVAYWRAEADKRAH